MAKKKRTQHPRSTRRADPNMKLLHQSTKAIVGVTALGITANALKGLTD